jgi:hypothetical protein
MVFTPVLIGKLRLTGHHPGSWVFQHRSVIFRNHDHTRVAVPDIHCYSRLVGAVSQ